MWFAVRVGSLSAFVAFVVAVVFTAIAWTIVACLVVVWLVVELCRPSVRREIRRGWKGEGPYAQ